MLDICGQKRGQSLIELAQWCDVGSHVSRVQYALRVLFAVVCFRIVVLLLLPLQDSMAQMTQLEKSWSLWFGALCEQHGHASSLDFSSRFNLCELSFWIAENEIDTWEHLEAAPEPGTWPGASKFDSSALVQVAQLRKKRLFSLRVSLPHGCSCLLGAFVVSARRPCLQTVRSRRLWSCSICSRCTVLAVHAMQFG